MSYGTIDHFWELMPNKKTAVIESNGQKEEQAGYGEPILAPENQLTVLLAGVGSLSEPVKKEIMETLGGAFEQMTAIICSKSELSFAVNIGAQVRVQNELVSELYRVEAVIQETVARNVHLVSLRIDND